MTTPADAIESDVARRTRAIGVFVVALSAIALVATLLIDGDPLATRIHIGALFVQIAVGSWIVVILRNPRRLNLRITRVFGVASLLVLGVSCYYWGYMASVVLLFPVGATAMQIGENRERLLGPMAYAIHISLTVAILTGVIEDRGLITIPSTQMTTKIIASIMSEALLIASSVLHVTVRWSSTRAVNDLHAAMRALAQRDAQLSEAERELLAARGAGSVGRYTGRTIRDISIGRVIGRGGLGEVYEGRTTVAGHGKDVAIKFLYPNALANPGMYKRFLREMQVVARLDSPNIVSVYEPEADWNGLPHLVMERLDGCTLADHLRKAGRMSVDDVVDLVAQTASGLSVAHEVGVIHRDLKPHNVFRHRADDRVVWKILDFGVCRLLDAEATITADGVVGTPAYMAPEQIEGGHIGRPTDVHALALTAYRALTGRSAYGGRELIAVLDQIRGASPTRPGQLVDIPPDVDLVFAIALSKRPEDRFQTAAEFASALASAARDDLSADTRARGARACLRAGWSVASTRAAR